MRIPRIYTAQPLKAGEAVTLAAEPSKHLIRVLRMAAGAQLVLFNGDGQDYLAELKTTAKQAEVQLLSCTENTRESPLNVHLLQGISRGERMDYAIQKAVELGVSEITPVFTERTVVKLPAERLAKKQQHWQGVLQSACEQSGRATLPTLNPAIQLHKLTEVTGLALTLDPCAESGLSGIDYQQQPITLLIGPEGGLSDAEINAAKQTGFTGVRIGPRILRTETAAVATLAALQALWGDWR